MLSTSIAIAFACLLSASTVPAAYIQPPPILRGRENTVDNSSVVNLLGSLVPYSASDRPNPLRLAVSPSCGSFSSSSYTDVGYNYSGITTLVTFGDSWTTTGTSDGSASQPPIVLPPISTAGGRFSDGMIWTEWISNITAAGKLVIKNYAVVSAVSDASYGISIPSGNDFIAQMNIFLSQGNQLDPDTTLYTVYFGINDYIFDKSHGANFVPMAKSVLSQINRLIAAPTNAKNIVFFSPFFQTAAFDIYENTIFQGLAQLRSQGKNTAFVNIANMYKAINATPTDFGFTKLEPCLPVSETTIGACPTPDTYLYWMSGHQQTFTHSLVAQYTLDVLANCA